MNPSDLKRLRKESSGDSGQPPMKRPDQTSSAPRSWVPVSPTIQVVHSPSAIEGSSAPTSPASHAETQRTETESVLASASGRLRFLFLWDQSFPFDRSAPDRAKETPLRQTSVSLRDTGAPSRSASILESEASLHFREATYVAKQLSRFCELDIQSLTREDGDLELTSRLSLPSYTLHDQDGKAILEELHPQSSLPARQRLVLDHMAFAVLAIPQRWHQEEAKSAPDDPLSEHRAPPSEGRLIDDYANGPDSSTVNDALVALRAGLDQIDEQLVNNSLQSVRLLYGWDDDGATWEMYTAAKGEPSETPRARHSGMQIRADDTHVLLRTQQDTTRTGDDQVRLSNLRAYPKGL